MARIRAAAGKPVGRRAEIVASGLAVAVVLILTGGGLLGRERRESAEAARVAVGVLAR